MIGIFLRSYLPLPTTVKGLTVQDNEGSYNICPNPGYTCEANQQTFRDELEHIKNNDFQNIYI